ncbi:MAG: Cache 3/Cache 2 fusion domain-containing protein, partial [Sulfurospirillaceae bacterium]|nr:Cache 3/Cache 2 fusion domain-containing protein [Sulfurospirillaceae bacterium]
MIKSITNKVLIIQAISITLFMAILTIYLNGYLQSHINTLEKNNIKSGLYDLKTTVDVYSKSLDETAIKMFNVFKGSFREVSLIEDQSVDVNGVKTPMLADSGEVLNKYFKIVDHFTKTTGAVATIFAYDKNKKDFVRVNTSLRREDGKRALGTYLGSSSPAYKKIMQKQSYIGMTRLFGKNYITVYRPLFDYDKKLIGILFIGYDFSNGLQALKSKVDEIKIGQRGYYYAIDAETSKYSIHKKLFNKKIDREIDKQILKKKDGFTTVDENGDEIYYEYFYFKKWNWIFVGRANMEDFKSIGSKISNILIFSTIIVTILLLLITWLVLNKLLSKPLSNLTQRAKELSSGDGDLTQKLEVNGNDEIALASIEINNFIEKVRV